MYQGISYALGIPRGAIVAAFRERIPPSLPLFFPSHPSCLPVPPRTLPSSVPMPGLHLPRNAVSTPTVEDAQVQSQARAGCCVRGLGHLTSRVEVGLPRPTGQLISIDARGSFTLSWFSISQGSRIPVTATYPQSGRISRNLPSVKHARIAERGFGRFVVSPLSHPSLPPGVTSCCIISSLLVGEGDTDGSEVLVDCWSYRPHSPT
ncbi:hypothetical protein BDM02DRAFT_2890121 [Thelephora ganbajun]|uniref:Uncharacterized protein n=1 Tax=Thelephora ganbajun TaxID=370292 RepID=A0ACB6ZB85_THEGA|nr:hypothetical protein BDM02DRAFT_2890121 [Thelephora ganbajun]